ncbi:MAG: HAMP domain-containing sensor histidine kinase [Kiritimatiellia bacterium]|jgi:signal transduction histidine kinase|nr:HAMP domain-containing sensor histidine kinase [Kiritimatiellia bacterium]
MNSRTLRKNYLLALSAVVYLVTLLLLLSELDRQYYQVEKESTIKYNFRTLFPHDTRPLQDVTRRILARHDAEETVDRQLEKEWRQIAQGLLSGEGCVFRIRIVPKDEAQLLVQVDNEKFDRLNGFGNTLFYRNFQNVVSYEIAGAAEKPWTGLLSFHYTTPGSYQPIVALTNRYRLWALLMFALVTAGYAVVLRKLIFPIKRVVSRIDAVSSSAPQLMPKPSSVLEKAYNDLARDAILLRLGQSIRNIAAGDPAIDRSQLLARAPRVLVQLLDYRAALVYDVSPDESGQLSVSGCVGADDGRSSRDYEAYCMQHVFIPGKIDGLAGVRRELLADCAVCDITQPEDRPHLTFLVLFLPAKLSSFDAELREWHLETVERVAEQLRDTVAVFDMQWRHVRNERSRANINLARNLGHDLTNIIATSKLDILTATKILDAGEIDGSDAAVRRQLLSESVQGLLNNARLLQEVVNIYRSFSYINRPRFETVSINRALDEIIEVFSFSLPGKTIVRKHYDQDLPESTVEPRLLKLAVFNILSNAVDAIKLSGAGDGEITVFTSMVSGSDDVCISIRDNGMGIPNPDGQLASQAEIDKIFRYGVSTKTEEGGEGLGLSWVWTIVEEFHGGKVQARNHPDGGAEFSLLIPIRDNDNGVMYDD